MVSRQQPARFVDWVETHQTLTRIQERLERRWAPSHEEKRKILQARARLLAREPQEPRPTVGHLEVVEFLLAHEKYGIESSYVREVYPLRDLTPLPCTPPFVLGVTNVRGEILSIIDIRKFFDLPEKGLTDLNKVIIVRSGATGLGILADSLLGMRSVPLEELQPSLPTLTGIRADYLQGVTKERLVVLDARRILTDNRIIVDGQSEE